MTRDNTCGTAAQGATFTEIGNTAQWQVHNGLNNTNETLTMTGNPTVKPSDYAFM